MSVGKEKFTEKDLIENSRLYDENFLMLFINCSTDEHAKYVREKTN